MFSAISNAQNKTNDYTPINSVRWNPSTFTTSEYTGSLQTVKVDSVDPINADYYVDTIGAIDAGQEASSTLYGANSYSGTFNSPKILIVPAQLTGSRQDDGGYYTGQPITGVVATNINGTYTGDATITATDVGTYGPNVLTGSGNYTGYFITGQFTISPGYFTVLIQQSKIDHITSAYSIKVKSQGPSSASITIYNASAPETPLETININDQTFTEGSGLYYVNGIKYNYTSNAVGYNDYSNSFNY
jgi:hypothetical protein